MSYLHTTTRHHLPSLRKLLLITLAPTDKASIFTSGNPKCFPSLSSCSQLNSVLQIHAFLIVSGLQTHQSLDTHLAKSHLSSQRCNLSHFFDSTPYHRVIFWNCMIRAYGNVGNYRKALRVYHLMLDEGLEPDKYTFTFVLRACTGAMDFQEGVLVHNDIVLRGLESDVFIGTGLVKMYCEMGDLGLARDVFDKMPKRDVVAWNAMILGLSRSEDPNDALELFGRMRFCGLEPNLATILNLVPAVSRLGDIDACRSIHSYVTRRGFDIIVSNGLIDMYAKCGDVDAASQIFELMRERNDVAWGTMIAGYAHNKCSRKVLELVDCMNRGNVRLNKVSAVGAVMAAAEMRDLKRGKEIHECTRQQGIDSDVSVATSIMAMYVKCGEVDKAIELFQGIKGKDLVAWSAIIAAFVQSGYPEEALALFRDMLNESLVPNKITLMSVLPACAELSALRLGKSIHCYAVKINIDSDMSVGTALVSMYAKSGYFTSALIIFSRMPCKDVATWNALINGYTQIGDAYHSIYMFHKLQLSKIRPNSGTMVGLLPACALLYDIDQGSCTHGQIIKCGFESDYHVQNALIDMYAKCGRLSSAEFLFNRTSFTKDEVSWNIMIKGFMHNGHARESISAFHQMKLANFRPNLVTIVSVLPAAACLSALREGMTLHACTIQLGFQSNTLVRNCLLDMYAKCGNLGFSENIFHEMKNKSTISWNAMLGAYAAHGLGNNAVELFTLMQENRIKADSLTFVSVLSACRHTGLIEEGRNLFKSMCEKHQLEPHLEHYACMVDLLGRAGLFDEIFDMINEMPFEPDAEVWGALLGACVLHSNLQLAEFAMDHLLKLDPKNPTHYVTLSSLYAKFGRWGDASNTKLKMIEAGLKKSPAYSWV